tara:strand:- start:54 stop:254 length:201 start_codon:yes stop_codon:yes gene_type:complete
MEPATLRENFTTQFENAVTEIKNLEAQLQAKRELALKLKGALEAIDIMDPPTAEEETSEEEPVAAE